MRHVIISFLLFFSFTAYSQFNVGDSKELVISALERNNIEFTQSMLTDSTSRISVLQENEYQMIWILDATGKVTKQTLIPEMENGVNEYVKWFNKDFVIISDTEWKNYDNGRIYKIQLESILQEYFFSITLSSETE